MLSAKWPPVELQWVCPIIADVVLVERQRWRMAHSKHSRRTPSWLSHAVKILNPGDRCRYDVVHPLGLRVLHKTTVARLVIL